MEQKNLHGHGGGLESRQHYFVNAISYSRSFDFTLDQAGIFQNSQVLTHRGLGQRKYPHDFSANAPVHFDQVSQDFQPNRMPQGFAHQGELFIRQKAFPGDRGWFQISENGFYRLHRKSTIYDEESTVKG
jgi:hypothetical protein